MSLFARSGVSYHLALELGGGNSWVDEDETILVAESLNLGAALVVFSALCDLNLGLWVGRRWVGALLLGELRVDEVDLVAILNDLVVLEESVVHRRELRQVLELKVLGV